MKTQRLIVFLLLVCFALSSALSEGAELPADRGLSEQQLFEELRPLLDLTVSAATQTENIWSFERGQAMPEEAALALVRLAPGFPTLGFTPDAASAWLSSNYDLTIPEIPQASPSADPVYTGVMMISLSFSPDGGQLAVTSEIYRAPAPYTELSDAQASSLTWLDSMAMFTLERSDAAALGWKVTSLSCMPSYFAEDTEAPQPGQDRMADHYDERFGISLRYPAEMAASAAQTETGFEASLPDGTADLRFLGFSPSEHTLDDLAADMAQKHENAALLPTELDAIRLLHFTDGGKTGRWVALEQNGHLVTLSFIWDPAAHPDYESLWEIMLQSLLMASDSQG